MQSWPAPPVPRLPSPSSPTELRLHDSASRGLVPVRPEDGVAKLYVCGITPYDATHLGHAATFLAFDTLVRVWLDQGVEVRYVQNVTDIDDPLLERAVRDGMDWQDVARRDTQLLRDDLTALRVVPPTWYVGAVEAMDEIAALVQDLVLAGAGYDVEGDTYFPVAAAAHFGQVAGLDRDTMLALSAERGGDPGRPGKRDPLDPLLWLKQREGEPGWDSPLGTGRPGWHVECSAIALNRLGPVLDVQGGGSDLLFPHHEMSTASTEAATGAWPTAHAYVHAGMIGLDGEKMSKSRGNLVFVSTLLAGGVEPGALRLALLSGHYRSDRAWQQSTLDAADQRVAAWRVGVGRATGPDAGELLAALRAALSDDLDTPAALAAVDAWCHAGGPDEQAPGLVLDAVDALLGVDLR